MQLNILTIFPQMFDSYLRESILFRAQKNKLIKLNILNIRDFTTDKHHKVDDKPFGGGPGMVMKVEPIYRALKKITKCRDAMHCVSTKKTRIILLSAKGKTFDAKEAKRLSKYQSLTFICGRYEGVDERVAKYLADEEMSIGNYVLTGGELPAMVIIDAVSRFIPGVLGKAESLAEESFSFKEKLGTKNLELGTQKEYPQYTRPEVFSSTPLSGVKGNGQRFKKGVKWAVPKILLSGDHKKIEEWRKKQRS